MTAHSVYPFHLLDGSDVGAPDLNFRLHLDNTSKTPRIVYFSSRGLDDRSSSELLHRVAVAFTTPQRVHQLFVGYDELGSPIILTRHNFLQCLRNRRPTDIVVLVQRWEMPAEIFGEGLGNVNNPRFDVEGACNP